MNIPDFSNSSIKNVKSDAKAQMFEKLRRANSGILSELQGGAGTRVGVLATALKGKSESVLREGNNPAGADQPADAKKVAVPVAQTPTPAAGEPVKLAASSLPRKMDGVDQVV